MFKSELKASSIHDAFSQKQKNYDIIYKWCIFQNLKMFMASGIYDAWFVEAKRFMTSPVMWCFFKSSKMFMASAICDTLYRSEKIYDITYNVMTILKMPHISFTWCLQAHFCKFLTCVLHAIIVLPKGKTLFCCDCGNS